MREGHRANALLAELLLVIFFFLLGSTTLVELFAGAKHKTIQARATNMAVMEAENLADDLYGSDDPETTLKDYGFTRQDDSWVLEKDGYTLRVTGSEETTEAGKLRTFMITGSGDGRDLFALPSTRYLPEEVSP